MLSKSELASIKIICSVASQIYMCPFNWNSENNTLVIKQNKDLYKFREKLSTAIYALNFIGFVFGVFRLESIVSSKEIVVSADLGVAGLVVAGHLGVFTMKKTLWRSQVDFAYLLNQIIQFNFRFGHKLFGTSFDTSLKNLRCSIFIIIHLGYTASVLVFTSLTVISQSQMKWEGISLQFILFSLMSLLIYMDHWICATLNITSIFVSIVGQLFWIERIAMDSTNIISMDSKFLVYKSIYIINYVFNSVFGSFFIPLVKLLIVLMILLMSQAVIRFGASLHPAVYTFLIFLLFMCCCLIIPIAIVMSNLYRYSQVFFKNVLTSTLSMDPSIIPVSSPLENLRPVIEGSSADEIRQSRSDSEHIFSTMGSFEEEAKKELTVAFNLKLYKAMLRSCRVIRCQVGPFYTMESKAKLTLVDTIIQGIVFMLVSV